MCSVEDYVRKDIIKSRHIIKQVVIKNDPNVVCGVRRFNIVRFEYPIFNLAVAFRVKDKVVLDSRIVIRGISKKHRILHSEIPY